MVENKKERRMELIELSNGTWQYSFSFNGRSQKCTRSTQREAQQAMREDLEIAKAFWRNYED